MAIYWLQPGIPIHHLDFWLPTTCIVLTLLTWVFTRPKPPASYRSDLITGLVIAGIIVLIGLTRYLGPACCLTPTRPPSLIQILVVTSLVASLSFLIMRFSRGRTGWIYACIMVIIGMFIILKSETLAKTASAVLRSINSQSIELASAFDLRWLGFSYVAFRLIHTLRDRLSGRLPDLSLQEFMIYVIFFPAISAGPIDRVQRFTQDLRQPFHPSRDSTLQGGKRIVIGMFSKFVLADSLAIFALSSTNASQVSSGSWLWLMLYAFSLRIFFDFSGYTDIAIGMGQLLGIRLPENFERPYLKQNLTLFWNSWHITLAQWFRAYFFNPLTRALRADRRNIPMALIIFVGQLSTFILIGLWHGISWNFAIWGAWHGLGLFTHNRWTDIIRKRGVDFSSKPGFQSLAGVGGTFLTFNYVALGWVWFALNTPAQSWSTLLRLFGFR
jgi:alginate O-acetyltransferase complex protein AlgI